MCAGPWKLCVQLHGLERTGQEEDASLQPGVDVEGAAAMCSGGGRGKPLPACAAIGSSAVPDAVYKVHFER